MPRSWNLKRFLGLDNKQHDVKQNEAMQSDDTSVKPEKEIKKKRKAPDIPIESKPKYPANGSNGQLNVTVNASVHYGHSMESLTSSSTDFSPSSRSFTLSSISGSVELMNNSENLSARSAAMNGEGNSNHVEVEISSNDDPSPCSDVGDYVEKALHVSLSSNLDSTRPEDSSGGLVDVNRTHHPPRLASFESSTMLHQEGLAKAAYSVSTSLDSCLNAHYVSLDYVKSAAIRNRPRSNDGNEVSGSSSLSSSFMLAVDSEPESTIGSDVVDQLYDKVTNGKQGDERSQVKALEVKTGDIETDLFPLIFPGHNRSKRTVVESQANDDVSNDVLTASNNRGFPSSNDNRPSSNFRNSNRCSETDKNQKPASYVNSETASESNETEFLRNETFTLNKETEIDQCERCSGVVINLDQTMDEDVVRAKDMFGRCICGPLDEQEAVTEMDYCSCNLEEIPMDIKDYKSSLVKLSLESNTIAELTQELFLCNNLTFLSVSDNDITSLPTAIARLSNLKHLDISKNVIKIIPDCIRCLKSLEVLDTSVNPIEKLSEGFTQLLNLREAYMNDCFFEFLPANFGRMTKLQVVELRDNQLQILPKSMRRLSSLTRLDLGGNLFQEWPDVISKLTCLKHLWLDCNELSNVSLQVGNLTQLTYLDLSRNFLESIPHQIGSLEHLTDLILSENTITSLPDSIGFLARLHLLNLEINQIRTLPESFGKLRNLEEVDLSHNKLEEIPSSVGRLKKLTTLLLDDNLLSEIPTELGNCTELSVLHLNRNQINEVPRTFGNLSNLKVLNICQNRIPFLPTPIKKLSNLEALWISPNQSKPVVPLQTRFEPSLKQQVLTNILFPQDENGCSRVIKVLGIPDDDDETSYANDAADDDDLEAYARRERGKLKVVFDLDATTYSSDVDEMHAFDDDVEPMVDEDNESLNNEPASAVQSEEEATSDEILISKEEVPEDKNNNAKALEKVSSTQDYVKVEDKQIDNKNVETPDETRQSAVMDCETKSSSESLSDESGKIFRNSLPSSAGLKTWSSRSNLPSASLKNKEKISEKELLCFEEPDSCLEDPNTCKRVHAANLRNCDFQPTLNIEKQPTVNVSVANSIAEYNDPLSPSTKPDTLSSLDINDIPFMDSCDTKSEPAFIVSDLTENPGAKTSLESDCAKSENSKSKSLKYPRNAVDVIEEKTSSTTSYDVLVTDHDSGVGNDVESQESIPDSHEETSVRDNCAAKVIEPIADGNTETRPAANAPSVRRNGGWIALVRTERLLEANDDNCRLDKTSQPTSPGKKLPQKPRYLPASAIDCTTVTYSHDYNKSKSKSRDMKCLPSSNMNCVAQNIKKFENVFDNSNKAGLPNNNRFENGRGKSIFNPKSNSVLPDKSSLPTTATINTTKPVAVATILPSTNRILNSEQRRLAQSLENAYAEPFAKTNYDAPLLREPYSCAEANTISSPTVQRVERSNFPNSDVDSVGTNLQIRRVSARAKKSKFDEALAVTKHKHFREVLDKMTQEHNSHNPTEAQSQRLQRVSTSSLASVPRIKSPVPQQHSTSYEPTTLERKSQIEKSKSHFNIQHRLREKSQLKENLRTRSQDSKKAPTTSKPSRDSSNSVLQSDARNSAKCWSLKSKKPTSKSGKTSEKSLEERLGQLLLDGKENCLPCSGQTSERSNHAIPDPVSNVMQARKSEKALPADWKQQLLLYLEQKKLGSGNESVSRSLSSQSNSTSTRPRDAKTSQKAPAPLSAVQANYNLKSPTETKQKQFSGSQTFEAFARGSSVQSKLSGRRSSARYQRTRTPGPDFTSSENKLLDVVVRPKSAMDLPTTSFQEVDFPARKTQNQGDEKKHEASMIPNRAPPSYEDHILRRANTVAAVCDKQEYHDYVNVEYLNQLRMSGRNKSTKPTNQHRSNYPLRSSGSHDSVLNAKDRLHTDAEQSDFPAMKGSISHGSIPNNQRSSGFLQDRHHKHTFDPRHHRQQIRGDYDQALRPENLPSQTGKVSKNKNIFGEIPAPPKTVKNSVKPEKAKGRSTKLPGVPDHYENYQKLASYDPAPPIYVDIYSKRVHPPHIEAKRLSVEKEDESVSSAFRPYHNKHGASQPLEGAFDGELRNVYHSSRYHQPHQQANFPNTRPLNSTPYHPHTHHHLHHNHRSNFYGASHYRRSAADPGAELVTVTIRKNPTFGFHIMGGIDSGGNPYRPDDDGVFVTYVSSGGSADGLVQPGDKILLVNGSDFVGITHKRAVDLLRNAGSNAVLVVERLIGRAV